MAVQRDPVLKRCRYLGISPAVVGINKESKMNPNANSRRKVSEYGLQLKEKQKLKEKRTKDVDTSRMGAN